MGGCCLPAGKGAFLTHSCYSKHLTGNQCHQSYLLEGESIEDLGLSDLICVQVKNISCLNTIHGVNEDKEQHECQQGNNILI